MPKEWEFAAAIGYERIISAARAGTSCDDILREMQGSRCFTLSNVVKTPSGLSQLFHMMSIMRKMSIRTRKITQRMRHGML